MLTHIVVWKYRAEVGADVRAEHIALLRRLASVIPEVQTLAVGSDTLLLPRSYDTGLVATFVDRARLDAYTVHPAHIKVAEFGSTISAQVASVDFES
jgi:hypothetical protein